MVTAQGRPSRIAVVGASGFEHDSEAAVVRCFRWDRLRKVRNLADYDVLVLDLLSLSDPTAIDAKELKKLLDVHTTRQVLGKGEGAIYVLGDPRFTIQYEGPDGTVTEPFLAWSGFDFSWDDRGGVAIERTRVGEEGPLTDFAESLDRYEYSMSACKVVKDDENALWGIWGFENFNGTTLQAIGQSDDLCTTRYGLSVAFAITHAVVPVEPSVTRHVGRRTYQEGGTGPPLFESGPILFLPRSRLSEEETIELILRDIYGVEISAPEPEWVEALEAPGQKAVDGSISEIDARLRELEAEREDRLRKRRRIRRPLALLYQTGDALEEAVWLVLEQLGAEVERPPEGENRADGWVSVRLEDETLEWVLEIKGEDKDHFGFKPLRQLGNWIADAVESTGKPYKGLMVGNSSRTQPPSRRIWPFNSNFLNQSRSMRHAVIRSQDLYVVYLLDSRGELDREGFWRGLFDAEGPLDVARYWAKLDEEEAEQLGAFMGRTT